MIKKKILILGASGFVGRNISNYLKMQRDYILLTPTRSELDILDERNVQFYMDRHKPNIILHVAIHNPGNDPNKDKRKILDYDLRMFYNLEKYSGSYEKMIYCGSGAEYDKRFSMNRCKEDEIGLHIPEQEYGFAKYIINQSIRASQNIYNLRIFGLFGPYENWRKTFISSSCCKAIKDLPLTIRQNTLFDYVWIDDFCKVIHWFIENTPTYHDYNITSCETIDLYSIAKMIIAISRKELPIYICKEGMANEYSGDNQRLIKDIGVNLFTPIQSSIKELYQWYLEHEDIIDIYPLLYQ